MKIFSPDTDKGKFFMRAAEHLLLGALLGALVEIISQHMTDEYGRPIGILFQSFSLILVMYLIKFHFSGTIGDQWQQITEGILFVAMYFGLQTTLYANINYYIKKLIVI